MLSYLRCLPPTLAVGLILTVLPSGLSAQTGAQPQGDSLSPAPSGQTNSSGRSVATPAQTIEAISATAVDGSGDVIPGATAVLQGASSEDRRTAVANDDGNFTFTGLKPGVPYHVTISAKGFVDWTSPEVTLAPGQFLFLSGVGLKLQGEETSVTVSASPAQIATEQVHIEEQQRVFGLVPNYYVVYDANAAPLTAKLKYSLALKTMINPITAAGVLFLAGINQAADTPDYVQGFKGYGQRAGAAAADGFTDIFIGGALLPSLLHQDPRYFYQGTGSNHSRLRHALLGPFVCKGDNGKWQPNFSTIGGDFASSAISNLYYPKSNRGGGIIAENVAISTAERAASTLMQEFVLRRFTVGPKNKN